LGKDNLLHSGGIAGDCAGPAGRAFQADIGDLACETPVQERNQIMIPLKRQQLILNHLLNVKVAAIGELAKLLKVSGITVRRDVQKLEGAGKVVSVSGGVAISTEIFTEPPHVVKRGLQREEKEAIADLAESLVEDGSTIYLDAGTTTLALARRLAEKRSREMDILVVTNDLVITMYLVENSTFRLYHTGGLVLRQNRSCVGDGTAKALRGLNIDLAFLSTPSWNSRWLSTPDAEKIPVKKAAVASANRRVLLADSSKYGKVGAFKAFPLSIFKTIITDDGLAIDARKAVEEQGVEVLMAKRAGKSRQWAG
jgi:DeoR/GlpR family transcriptional regulator of sugar metabolism